MNKLGNGQNIVFFHGGAIRYNSYLPLIKELAKHFNVYYFSLPGHDGEYTDGYPENAIASIQKIIEDEKIDNPTFIGHSFGGFCAYEVANRMGSIKKVILLDPLLIQFEGNTFQLLCRFFIKKNIRALLYNYKIFYFFLRAFFDLLINCVKQNFRTICTIRLLIRSVLTKKTKFEDKYELHIIHGSNDSIIPLKEIEDNYGGKVHMVKGEHDWCMNDVRLTLREIQKYL